MFLIQLFDIFSQVFSFIANLKPSKFFKWPAQQIQQQQQVYTTSKLIKRNFIRNCKSSNLLGQKHYGQITFYEFISFFNTPGEK